MGEGTSQLDGRPTEKRCLGGGGGGGGAMVWGCFWGGGFGPSEIIDTSSVDQETYIHVLANRFHPWFTNVTAHQERDFIFQEDSASCHTGGYARWWKKTHQIRGFEY
ncbi:hypothetical protein RO3G_06976 [Rhizopus delemar RA 99-880]|uniref:Tc1-like transposase DDE domain-containing protein n=1 Tax=Rhizopus delemar (strain RA 99-880 / ATCC MYA-4621 / FGSC 9543 / NRRL 43880) TaxID=246409 RepID=I1C1E1_RHIO9|nr:hypothetical protein RO3G_06976 [Rhizopus delemar RA 99-880]|eukprot:EIE82271.1 hypothetical protein RO3G_06976 [Rhizopus delemar RA 99-880]